MSYVKNYNVGKIQLELPTSNYIHEIPLLSIGDIHGSLNLSMVFNYAFKTEGSNPFNIAAGYKLNLQKRIIMTNDVPTAFQNESGKVVALISCDGRYTFDDDTQRIIRRTGAAYELENSDFSKETYDTVGKITNAYDKYGNWVLKYTYDATGKLTSITYWDRTIDFRYSDNRLTSIKYDEKAISISYPSEETNINQLNEEPTVLISSDTYFGGVSFELYSSGIDFSAVANGNENVSYTTKIATGLYNTMTISNLVGSKVVDSMTYKFPDTPNCKIEFNQVEITDKYGVKTRVQYQDGKPLYSYEISSDVDFVDNLYKGIVKFYNTRDEINHCTVSGAQGPNDGAFLQCTDQPAQTWEFDASDYDINPNDGYYVITGWVKAKGDNTDLNNSQIWVSSEKDSRTFIIFPDITTGTQWKFFVGKAPITENIVRVYPRNRNMIELKDVRIIFRPLFVPSDNGSTNMFLSDDILIYHGTSETKNIPIRKGSFACGGLAISDDDKVYYEDLLKFKINQRRKINNTEFYCNKGRKVISFGPTATVTVTYESQSYNLEDCYLGKYNYTSKGIVTTRLRDDDVDDATNFLVCETLDSNNKVISSQILDKNLDTVQTTIDGVTTFQTRDKGLITSEGVKNSYSDPITFNAITYDLDENTITVKDEFDKSTKYTLDPVWGVIKSVTLADGTVITDEYDDGRFAKLKRMFAGSTGRSTSFSYSGGNLIGASQNNLIYKFGYTDGNLSSIKKDFKLIEEHEITDTQIDSFYPSKSNKLYSDSVTLDKYGRLVSIAGELTNSYDISPSFSSIGEMETNANNANAHLGMSVDELRGETTRYDYDENGLVIEASTTDKNNFDDKKSEESFFYDEGHRLTEHYYTYDVDNSKYVSGEITYTKEATDLTADDTVETYTYKVNGVQQAKSVNSFDGFHRLNKKETKLDQENFVKEYTYDKTRIKTLTEKISNVNLGKNNYSYDALGRITSITYSSDKATNNYLTYKYDQYGQLVRENNDGLDKTFIYEYDSIGNLTKVKEYPFSLSDVPTGTYTAKTCAYNKDVLTNFNGKSIGYNSNGELSSYNGKTYSWNKGRLSRIYQGAAGQAGSLYEDCQFTYDAYGRRVEKTYNYDPDPGATNDSSHTYRTTYNYDNSGRLIREYTIENYISGTTTREFIFLYDESGIIGVMYGYNGSALQPYYYHKNLQGDVIAICDESGNIKAEYVYDAYGNCKIIKYTLFDLAINNPIRYRGYYLDRETGLYFLNTRYYNPEWRRFISPDSTDYLDPESVNGLNLYVYCGNDPANYSDPTGTFVLSALLIGLIIGAVVGATIGGVVAYNAAKDNGAEGWDLAGQTLLGALGGAVVGGALGAAIGYVAPAITSFMGASFSFTLPSLGALFGGSGSAAGFLVTVTGAQILQGAASVGALIGSSVLMSQYLGGWPGDDPSVSPGEGFEWRGPGLPGSSQGNWYNPKTGEILHPDLHHPKPIGPHWDYRDILKKWWRIFKNAIRPK